MEEGPLRRQTPWGYDDDRQKYVFSVLSVVGARPLATRQSFVALWSYFVMSRPTLLPECHLYDSIK